MSDIPTNNLEPEALDEELVAYLDGELPPDSAKRVESLLSADNKARERLGDLAASWDLLDQLPRATVDDLFTRTTVEMVAVAAESEIAAASAPAKRRLQWIGGAVAAVLAAMVGFAAAALALPNQNEALLKDLPVVADLELYRGVSDIAFLKQLQKANLFTEDPPVLPFPSAGATAEKSEKGKSDKPEKSDKEAEAVTPPIPASIEARRQWVAALPPAEKTELRRNFEWFESHPAEQQDLRQFDKALRSDPQAAELYKVMQRYHEWLTKTLNPYDRAELALKTSDARVTAIKQRQQSLAMQAFLRYAGGGGGGGGGPSRGPDQFGAAQQIGPAFRVAQQYALNHEDEILVQASEEKDRLAEIKREDKERDRRERYPAALAAELWRHNSPVKLPPIKDDELKELMKTLTKEQAERLKPIFDSPDRMNDLRKLVQLGIAANRPGGWGGGRGGGGPASEWLISQYPSEIQKQLKELPPQEREAKLRELRMSQDWPRAGMGPRPGGDGWFENRPSRGGQGEGQRRNPDGQPGDRPRGEGGGRGERGEGGRGDGGRRNQEPPGKGLPKDEP